MGIKIEQLVLISDPDCTLKMTWIKLRTLGSNFELWDETSKSGDLVGSGILDLYLGSDMKVNAKQTCKLFCPSPPPSAK